MSNSFPAVVLERTKMKEFKILKLYVRKNKKLQK